MKKVLLFAAVVSAFSFASCKKSQTCECKDTYEVNGVSKTDTESFPLVNTKKKNKESCDLYKTTGDYTSCEIK